jgi:nucleoside-diphosphate-sugar epimerase
MRVLVTGVSGTIGGAVARALVRRGHIVVGTVRAVDRMVPDGVEAQVAELFEPTTLSSVADDVDAAVHAASSNDERSGDLDRGVVEFLLGAFAGTSKPLIYTSGLWLHGDTGDTPATEKSPFAPPQVLSWRPALEQFLADAASTRHVHTVRIRPGLVYGGGRGYPSMLLSPEDDGEGRKVVRHIGDGSNRWSVVHADDLGDLYALAVESAPAGSVYLGTLDESVQVRDVAKAAADRHRATAQDWDPSDAARIWGVMVEAFLLDQVATSAKARSELGWTPYRPTLLEELAG